MNELLAFEISSPSTSAVIVPTTAIETETRLFVSSFRWCVGRRCRAHQPTNALPASTAKMMKPMIGGESVTGTRHSMMTERSSYRLSAALVDPSQGRERYRASYCDNFGLDGRTLTSERSVFRAARSPRYWPATSAVLIYLPC